MKSTFFSTTAIQLLNSSTVDFSPSAIERCQSLSNLTLKQPHEIHIWNMLLIQIELCNFKHHLFMNHLADPGCHENSTSCQQLLISFLTGPLKPAKQSSTKHFIFTYFQPQLFLGWHYHLKSRLISNSCQQLSNLAFKPLNWTPVPNLFLVWLELWNFVQEV